MHLPVIPEGTIALGGDIQRVADDDISKAIDILLYLVNLGASMFPNTIGI